MLGDVVEGCLAIAIMPETFSENNGKLLRVGKFIGSTGTGVNLAFDDNWEVDPPVHFDDGKYRPICPGRFLKRIDEPEDDKAVKEPVHVGRSTNHGHS